MPQILNTNTITQVVIPPGGIIDDRVFPSLLDEFFTPFHSSKFHGQEIVTVRRDYALGDLLMLIPVLRQFKKKYDIKKIQLMTMGQYVAPLQKIFRDIVMISEEYMNCLNLGLFFNLNSVLEQDHSIKNQEREMHRCAIYARALDFELSKELNWEGKIYTMPVTFTTKRKKIALQIRGSGNLKTLPFPFVNKIIESLCKKYHVIPLDHEVYPQFKGEEITNVTGRLSIPETVELLRNVDICITMDSGVLWMAHIANCPVVTFLGPTREEERLTLHPGYPQKAIGISLSKEIGCIPCFETKSHCKGKIRCMWEFNQEHILNILNKKINLILGDA